MATVAEIRERLEKATPGPWHACGADAPEPGTMSATIPTVRHKHGACSCGHIWSEPVDAPVAEVIGGPWGDSWAAIRKADDGQLEAYMERCDYGEIPREHQAANMKFIAHAPTDIAFLLDRVESLESALRHMLDLYEDHYPTPEHAVALNVARSLIPGDKQ